jgi:hypothetical protein
MAEFMAGGKTQIERVSGPSSNCPLNVMFPVIPE